MQSAILKNPDYFFSRFCVCGISYQKTDASTRGLFHIDETTKVNILQRAKSLGITSLFILSTCNRTELYAYVQHPDILADLFITAKKIDCRLFFDKQYLIKGQDAMQHLFEVGAGLDSQILGDYEILSQLKQSISFSKKHDMIGPIMDRTMNYVFQASKKVKTTTTLSSGTTSVSFAAIEWLKKNAEVCGKKILLIGLGKFGSAIGKNLKHYFPATEIVVCNRTDEKALAFAELHSLVYASYQSLPSLVDAADIIIASTQSPESTVLPEFLISCKQRIFMDLSIPSNIHPGVKDIRGQRLVNVDDISVILNHTLEMRKKEIPGAVKILKEVQAEFISWLSSYSHAPLVKEMKDKLFELSKKTIRCELAGFTYDDGVKNDLHNIKKTISRLAINLRTKNEKGCQLIEAYNHFLNNPHSA